MMPTLQNWKVQPFIKGRFLEPVQRGLTITGDVVGRSDMLDGLTVRTSVVLSVDGRVIKTRNSTYRLGKIDRKYRAWLKRMGIRYDPQNPVKPVSA